MSRQDRFSWFSARQQKPRRLKSPSRAFGRGYSLSRRLHIEPLEDRRMLAVITVDSLADNMVVDGSITLREAIQAANTDASVDGSVAGSGDDTIEFSAALSGETITLSGADLEITEAVTIDATSLAVGVTIDADELSRIFSITATSGDFVFAGLTITGGKTTGDNGSFPIITNLFSGGAIRSLTTGNLTIDQSTVRGNSTEGTFVDGGGIYSSGDVTLTSSTISGNSATGISANGGGIHAYGDVMLTSSTVSGNSTTGGVFGGGGGILSHGVVVLTSSTVTDNHTNSSSSTGGGIWNDDDTITITNSIVVGNTAGGGSPDIDPGTGTFAIDFSLLGTAVNPDAGGTGNLFNDTPFLGALADNGGPTETHALLVSSPAINAGDPSFTAPPDFDQRGTGFPRVNNDRLDAGAFEFLATFPAQGLVVDTATDLVDGDFTAGNLSLREAIAWSNIDPLANLVTFDTSLSGQAITLGGAELQITEAVTIDATSLAQNVTIDADELSRIFNISATSGDFTLAGLTFTGGRTTGDNVFPAKTFSGGAVRSLTTGSLIIDQSTIVGNSTMGSLAGGSGIFSTGAVILTNSSVTGNSTTGTLARGGGIYSDATVLLTNSTVSDNSTSGDSADGGGIFSLGDVTLTNSTLGRNSTSGSLADGGGVFSGGAVTLTSSTVSGNSTAGDNASGGGVFSYGVVTLISSTVTDNHANYANATGGGIRNNDDTITITHSILAGNTAGGGSPDIDPGSGIFAADFSLLGTAVTPGAGGAGNLFGDTPLLGVLADNGGPTQTHALLAGSPAIDAGDPAIVAPPANDQRGALFLRQNGTIDIGAFEIQPQSLIVDTLVDENDGDYSSGDLSLREAIEIANAVPVTESITFAAALDGGTITLGGAELEITEALTIDATALTQSVTIDANSASRIFDITATSGDFILAGLTLIGGRTTGDNATGPDTTFDGGAIRSLTTGNLTIDQSTVSGSSTTGDRAHGGGIFSTGAVVFTSSTISGNSTAGESASGGGIFSTGAVTLTSSTVSGNSTSGAVAAGGGILSLDDISLETSTVSGNSTTGNLAFTGGMRSLGVTTLTNSTVSGNSTAGNSAFGGGISGFDVTLISSTVSGNSTTGSNSDGGGISAGGVVTLSNSTVTDNHANHFNSTGGGIWNSTTTPITITHSILSGNTAGGFGPDIDPGTGIFAVDFSLLGTTVTPDAGGSGNLFNDSPLLGQLAGNGGPTETHRLLCW